METPFQPSPQPPAPKKSKTGLIIGISVVVLLCFCCLIVLGVLFGFGKAIGDIFSSVDQGLQSVPEIPTMVEPFATPESDIPSVEPTLDLNLPSGTIPEGGLGDDILRADTWAYVLVTSASVNCINPAASDTVIDVLQQPDSTGIWTEQWTVTCADGNKKSFDVSFSPGASGGTDISVTVSK